MDMLRYHQVSGLRMNDNRHNDFHTFLVEIHAHGRPRGHWQGLAAPMLGQAALCRGPGIGPGPPHGGHVPLPMNPRIIAPASLLGGPILKT